MKRYKEKKKRIARIAAALLLLTAVLFLTALPETQPVHAEETAALQQEEVAADGEKQLVITVVEDVPAVEIEENEVPLAAYPDTANRSGTRHAALMAVVLLCVICYVIYMGRYEKKLSQLRKEAAGAEYRFMQMRREQKGPEEGPDGEE